jgi:hypothetical protein
MAILIVLSIIFNYIVPIADSFVKYYNILKFIRFFNKEIEYGHSPSKNISSNL